MIFIHLYHYHHHHNHYLISWLMTCRQPLPKRLLRTVRSGASFFFNLKDKLVFLRSPTSCWCLLLRRPVPSVSPSSLVQWLTLWTVNMQGEKKKQCYTFRFVLYIGYPFLACMTAAPSGLSPRSILMPHVVSLRFYSNSGNLGRISECDCLNFITILRIT